MNKETELPKRVTMKRARPNPLFESWLQKLLDEAKQKKSNLEPVIQEALDSIMKYPLPLKTGKECIMLKGFNKKLCMFLDQTLQTYNENVAQCSPQSISSSSSNSSKSEFLTKNQLNSLSTPHTSNYDPVLDSVVNTSNANVVVNSELNPVLDVKETAVANAVTNSGVEKRNNYMPAFRSGPYAILRALLEQHFNNPTNSLLTKDELIEKAQNYSEESFVKSKPGTFYTAWSTMTRLVTKKLVEKVGNKKAKYQLTSEGVELASEMIVYYKDTPTDNDIIFKDEIPSCSNREEVNTNLENEEVSSSQPKLEHDETVIEFLPCMYEIILLIDKNETGGVSKKNDPTVAQFKKYYDLNHEYRNLKVGDFTWIARHQIHKEQELVLPYIVERKRMDDLAASIKDGRFHEQKFRLRKCGIPNIIYLVENHGKNKNVGLPMQNLQQAMANTRVQDGFKVHLTDSLRNSARYLAMMTRRLTIRYKDKVLRGRNTEAADEYLMSFEYFNKVSAKNKTLTVTETFIKLLLQLKGISVEKALAITSKYSTPKSLFIAYKKCDSTEGEYLLANLKYGELGRNVGPVASRAIYQLFTLVHIE